LIPQPRPTVHGVVFEFFGWGLAARPCRCRVDGVLLALTPAQDLHGQHRVIEPLELEIVERTGFDGVFDDAVDAAADHDLVGLGFAAQTGGEVGNAADRCAA